MEIEGVRPIWRDPRRNSVHPGAKDVQNGWMATQLVTKRCDLGSLGVPGPASTPLGGGQAKIHQEGWGSRLRYKSRLRYTRWLPKSKVYLRLSSHCNPKVRPVAVEG